MYQARSFLARGAWALALFVTAGGAACSSEAPSRAALGTSAVPAEPSTGTGTGTAPAPAGDPNGPGAGAAAPLPALPRLPGDRLAARLVDLAGGARFEGPPLGPALAAFDTPYKLVSPYSGLRGEQALRVVEVAVTVADVETYPPADPPGAAASTATSSIPASPPRFDPVWNRYRGVYESKVALLAPAPSCYRFSLTLPRRGLLTLHAAAIPGQKQAAGGGKAGDGTVTFRVLLDGQTLWQRQAAAKAGTLGRWLPADIPLPRPAAGQPDAPPDGKKHELALCSESAGPAAGVAVFGNPELWDEGEGAAAPNVLLVLVDTLRADALPMMPRLRALAEGGARFDQAITAATWTRPALLALLGGDLPTSVGQSAEEMIPKERDRQRFYALDRRLLPRVLRDAGLKVASIGNNFFLLGYPQIGLSIGFDEVADVRHPVADSPAITRAAVQFLRKQAQRSFFLQLHYDAPHWPYSPPPELVKGVPDALVKQLTGGDARLDPQARAYLGEAAYADAQIGAVLDELTRLGLDKRTLVVVVGDHGEVFDPQHNHFVLQLGQPTLYHHGWSAYDEILRVPLVLSLPGRIPAGVKVASQVRLTDVAPTVLEVLGLGGRRGELPGGRLAVGRSLWPLIDGRTEPAERVAFIEGQNVRAVRAGGFLYLRRRDARLQHADGNSGTGSIQQVVEELYDLHADPFQHRNLVAESKAPRPPAVERSLQQMRAVFARHAPAPPDARLPVTHLQLAEVTQGAHSLTGTVTSADPQLGVRGVRGGEVTPVGPGRVEIALRSGGMLELQVDAAAKLELQLWLDGVPLRPEQLLVGPFSLPLLSGTAGGARPDGGTAALLPARDPAGGPLTIEGSLLERLSASYPPVVGERGDVLLWRDQSSTSLSAATASGSQRATQGEVATMMRDWGYAQPDKATPAAPATPGPAGPAAPAPAPGPTGAAP